jgi:hypothetical protein
MRQHQTPQLPGTHSVFLLYWYKRTRTDAEALCSYADASTRTPARQAAGTSSPNPIKVYQRSRGGVSRSEGGGDVSGGGDVTGDIADGRMLRGVRENATRYSIYLLYYCTSTNTDAEGAPSGRDSPLGAVELGRQRVTPPRQARQLTPPRHGEGKSAAPNVRGPGDMLVKVRSNAVNAGEVDEAGGGRRRPREDGGGGRRPALGATPLKPSLPAGRGRRGGGQGGGDAGNEGLGGQKKGRAAQVLARGEEDWFDKHEPSIISASSRLIYYTGPPAATESQTSLGAADLRAAADGADARLLQTQRL